LEIDDEETQVVRPIQADPRKSTRAAVGQPPTSKVVADKRNQIHARLEKREMAELGRREEE
jgi:hypothetical protein